MEKILPTPATKLFVSVKHIYIQKLCVEVAFLKEKSPKLMSTQMLGCQNQKVRLFKSK